MAQCGSAPELRCRWYGPFIVANTFYHGAMEIHDPQNGTTFKVNGQRVIPLNEDNMELDEPPWSLEELSLAKCYKLSISWEVTKASKELSKQPANFFTPIYCYLFRLINLFSFTYHILVFVHHNFINIKDNILNKFREESKVPIFWIFKNSFPYLYVIACMSFYGNCRDS